MKLTSMLYVKLFCRILVQLSLRKQVMELCKGGSLVELLQKQAVDMAAKIKIIGGIAAGVQVRYLPCFYFRALTSCFAP
jgi:hypothetical protein